MVNWRDIQDKAVAFVHEWSDAKDEDKWAKAFWVRFFDVFGVRERSLGIFEERVKLLSGAAGKIDFFAPNRFIVEHKSRGKDLDSAFLQAADYMDALSEDEKPRYIIVSDFARFRIYDLEAPKEKREFEFRLADLPKHVQSFAFLTDEEIREYKEEDPINVRAVQAIGKLYEALSASNYPPESISPLLTRLVFCFFADDTGIFNRNDMRRYLEENTKADGMDIGAHLGQIFDVLNTPEQRRQETMPDILKALPYVNGGLFAEPLPGVFGSRGIRDMLMKCVEFNWSRISPAIFGSMFQSVMDEKQRHDLGAHYTSEKNILKVINGLFLEGLKEELEAAKTNEVKLNALWKRIATITLLDPACGCGNFLVIAYRELRHIELEIIKRLYKHGAAKVDTGHALLPLDVDIKKLSKLSVERMYGIEIEPFPAEIAKLSLWLMDHMMNVELGAYFGKPFRKLPLTEQPHIVKGNALRIDWESVVPKDKLTYILGNPPFLGSRVMDKGQKEEMHDVFGDLREVGFLDYVTAWYIKAAKLIHSTRIKCAFVSTNSISQGEQAGILWEALKPYDIHIHFAHRTFKWSNEATGKAAVYCVIIGFASFPTTRPRLFDYEDIKGEPCEIPAKEINPYLIAASADVIIRSRQKSLCDVPEMSFGNMPRDSGMFLLNQTEKDELLAREPAAAKFVRSFISAQEFLHGENRYCLWLVDAEPQELRELTEVMRRVESVKTFREMSVAASTRKMAETPYLFAQRTQPSADYVLIPRHSSENRAYIPIGFFTKENIVADSCMAIGGATLYHFGVLESTMHMAWMRAVCGRLESRYRYSKDIVYNNFPWPENPTAEQKKAVEEAAQAVLDARKQFPEATLADLYDPNTMPKVLLEAHHKLDRAVDACYGPPSREASEGHSKKNFKSEPERLEFLFERYKELTT
ncbi:MAG: class I SAM-dependent DNA methyltransferase [bacterium]|nr:class I SAM-dependent DNA methyltransferase [bacterium]